MIKLFNWLWIGDYKDLTEQYDKLDCIYVGSQRLPSPIQCSYIQLQDEPILQKKEIQKAVIELKNFFTDGRKVLICCDAGMSRSPYIVARFICYMLDCDMDTAYDMLQAIYRSTDSASPLRVNDNE